MLVKCIRGERELENSEHWLEHQEKKKTNTLPTSNNRHYSSIKKYLRTYLATNTFKYKKENSSKNMEIMMAENPAGYQVYQRRRGKNTGPL